ncbi:hypothetical protein GQ457_06G018070 [Hibiscus cannabinus]
MSSLNCFRGNKTDDKGKMNEISHVQSFNRLFIATTFFLQSYYETYLLKQPCMDSNQSGDAWIREILNSHELRCMINFRMSKMIFRSLLRVLESRYNLQTSRHVSSQEMLGIFLYMLGHGASVSQCQERFQRSGATISRYFTIMLRKFHK